MKKTFIQTFPFLYFLGLFSLTLLLFRKAYKVDFIFDDFFFLKIGKAESVGEFFNFFSPLKDYFYRPIPTELYYFFINITGQNLFLAHSVVFLVYFLGLFFLYKVTVILSKNNVLAYLLTFLYAIHFTHIFQLYQLATFIEICLFTFLVTSFYFFLQKKYFISLLFFIFALMSKETAVLFPLALFVYEFLQHRSFHYRSYKHLLYYFVIAAAFAVLFQSGTAKVSEIDTYKIHLSPRLILNNIEWYFLWSLGVPNFVPNYIKSILFNPLPEFWNLFNESYVKVYFYIFLTYVLLLGATILVIFLESSKKKALFFGCCVLFFFFLLFISPTLPIIHRWMVRLTVPLIFIISIQAYVIYLAYQGTWIRKIIAITLLCLYITMQYIGVQLHESSSLLFLNSGFVTNTRAYLAKHTEKLKTAPSIYFVDTPRGLFGGSKDLKHVFHDQNFLYSVAPGYTRRVFYGYEPFKIPRGSIVIEADEIMTVKQ